MNDLMSENISSNKLLYYFIKNSNMNLDDVQNEIIHMKKQDYLKKHSYEIWEGNNGKWYTYLPDKTKGRRLIKRTTKADIEKEIISYYKSKSVNPTIKECFYSWMKEKQKYNEICNGTKDRYETDFIRFFDKISERKVTDIVEDDIIEFMKMSIVEHKLSQKAYSNLKTLVIGIFKYAKKMKYTTLSISYVISDMDISHKSFNKTIKDSSSQVYTENEIPVMIKYLNEHEDLINLGILLVFETGLRCGELVALKREDIRDSTLQIRRTEIKYKFEDGVTRREVREFPKTENAVRDVILTKNAQEILKKIVKINPFGEYLFENEKLHTRICETTFNRRLESVCKKLGFQRKSMHKIRKTYGTMLIDANVDESIIMEQMGHSDIATTKKFYYYSNKGRKSKEQQINNAINF